MLRYVRDWRLVLFVCAGLQPVRWAHALAEMLSGRVGARRCMCLHIYARVRFLASVVFVCPAPARVAELRAA